MAQLNTTIHLADEHNRTFIFGPHEPLPDWAVAKLLSHGTPGIWAEAPEPTDDGEGQSEGGGESEGEAPKDEAPKAKGRKRGKAHEGDQQSESTDDGEGQSEG